MSAGEPPDCRTCNRRMGTQPHFGDWSFNQALAGEGGPIEELAALRAENERLKEQLRLTHIDWQNEALCNAKLEKVAQAARGHWDSVYMLAIQWPEMRLGPKSTLAVLGAALAELEGE